MTLTDPAPAPAVSAWCHAQWFGTAMSVDAMRGYAELGVDRLVVNLGSQRPERIDPRMADKAGLVKMAA